MSLYIKDPREMCIIPESGITLESDNRFETMYHWGAKVLDLCEMDVEEYMAPMTVIIDGYDGGDGPSKKSLSIFVEVITPDGDVIGPDGNIIGKESGNGEWSVIWSWNNDFDFNILSKVDVYDLNGDMIEISTVLTDNGDRSQTVSFENTTEQITSIGTFGIANEGTELENVTGKTMNVIDEQSQMTYNVKINVVDHIDVTFDIPYGYEKKNTQLEEEDLKNFSLDEAMDSDGFAFTMKTEISEEYVQKVSELDNDVITQEEFDEWVENYELGNRYTIRFYIPAIYADNYEYHLYNENLNQLIETPIVKSENNVFYNGVEYSEYVNSNTEYVYNDVSNTFLMNLKISVK